MVSGKEVASGSIWEEKLSKVPFYMNSEINNMRDVKTANVTMETIYMYKIKIYTLQLICKFSAYFFIYKRISCYNSPQFLAIRNRGFNKLCWNDFLK